MLNDVVYIVKNNNFLMKPFFEYFEYLASNIYHLLILEHTFPNSLTRNNALHLLTKCYYQFFNRPKNN